MYTGRNQKTPVVVQAENKSSSTSYAVTQVLEVDRINRAAMDDASFVKNYGEIAPAVKQRTRASNLIIRTDSSRITNY